MHELKIEKNDAGQRLDKFITKALDLPMSLLYKSIRLKKIKVNRKRAEARTILAEGDTIQCFLADSFFEKSNTESDLYRIDPKLNIVYEDENILLVDKKPGISVHEDEYGAKNTLITHILAYLVKKGEYNQAFDKFFEALKYNEENDEVYYQLGKCNYYIKSFQDAIAHFKRAISIKPQESMYYFGLGCAYDEMGSIKSAKMASWGIKRNSDTATLSGLIGAIVAFTFIAVSIVNIIIQATTTYNERFSCDYVIESIDESFNGNEIDTLVGNTYGVEYSRLFEYHQFYINYNGEEKDSYIYRVENSKSLDSAVFGLTKEEKEAFDNIDNGAIFSYDLINRYGFEVGDSAEIEIDGIKYKFIICGVDNSLTKNDRVIYVNEKFNQIEFEKFMILMGASKNVSNSDLYVELRDKLENYGCYVLEYRDWAYATAVGINGLAILLRSLEVLIAIVGILGVINMSIAMFIKRKREFEIYRAVGIDRKKYTVYTFFEGLIIATIGGIIGLVFSFVINLLMPDFAVMIDRHTVIDFFPYQILIITAICVVAYTVCYMTIATRFRPEKNTINRNQA